MDICNREGYISSSMASNTRFSVALHVLAFLAWNDEPLKSARVARSVGTSAVVIRRLLRRLADAGLVTSQRGPLGGTQLARRPAEISLLEVFRAVGDPDLLSRHVPNRHCPFGRAIRPGLEIIVDRVESGVRAELAKTTLAGAMRLMRRSSDSDLL